MFPYGWFWIAYTSVVDGILNRVRLAAAASPCWDGDPLSIEYLGRAVCGLPPDSMSNGDMRVRLAALGSLCRVLPSAPGSGYGLLDPRVTPALCRLMRGNVDAVLVALEVVRLAGSGSALPDVEYAARSSPRPRVREAAQRALDALNARRESEEGHQRLLRPLGSPGESMLLRPAGDAVATKPDHLLRPSSRDGQDVEDEFRINIVKSSEMNEVQEDRQI